MKSNKKTKKVVKKLKKSTSRKRQVVYNKPQQYGGWVTRYEDSWLSTDDSV